MLRVRAWPLCSARPSIAASFSAAAPSSMVRSCVTPTNMHARKQASTHARTPARTHARMHTPHSVQVGQCPADTDPADAKTGALGPDRRTWQKPLHCMHSHRHGGQNSQRRHARGQAERWRSPFSPAARVGPAIRRRARRQGEGRPLARLQTRAGPGANPDRHTPHPKGSNLARARSRTRARGRRGANPDQHTQHACPVT